MYQFIENGSITSVGGFKAAGIFCGIKRKRKDLALIYSETSCTAAGTFTLNKVKAPPLILTQETVKNSNSVKAVIVNSGNANACTGVQGEKDAAETQLKLAEKLGISQNEVLVSSTGVIGEKLPINKIIDGIDKIIPQLSSEGGLDAAEAIMTTDTKLKSFAVEVKSENKSFKIGSICKGSGMIAPNMATMLGFIGTDAKIEKSLLQKLLSEAVKDSFNKISVDGETSTNDMVLLMANGASEVSIEEGSTEYNQFKQALADICKEMAKSIVSDGEGATKLVTVNVTGAKSEKDADLVGKSIANSSLVKTAIYGSDANWGRIISAAGQSGADFEPDKVSISFDELPVLQPNYDIKLNEEEALKVLKQKEFIIKIDLGAGNSETTWWTCDFTDEYVRINSAYRS